MSHCIFPRADFPYMSFIESPLGSCGGALVAPGYVLTAAQVRRRGLMPVGRVLHAGHPANPAVPRRTPPCLSLTH